MFLTHATSDFFDALAADPAKSLEIRDYVTDLFYLLDEPVEYLNLVVLAKTELPQAEIQAISPQTATGLIIYLCSKLHLERHHLTHARNELSQVTISGAGRPLVSFKRRLGMAKMLGLSLETCLL